MIVQCSITNCTHSLGCHAAEEPGNFAKISEKILKNNVHKSLGSAIKKI